MLVQLKLTALLITRYTAGVIHDKANMAIMRITHEILMEEVRRIEAQAQ